MFLKRTCSYWDIKQKGLEMVNSIAKKIYLNN